MRSSILQVEKKCFICGKTTGLENHHVFAGPNRKNSDRAGLVLWLCHEHHNEPPYGAHFNRETELMLKRYAQEKYEAIYGHNEFMRVFGKNYL